MQSQRPSSRNTDKSAQAAQGSPQQNRRGQDSNQAPLAGQGGKNEVQGEGDYESNRRYTDSAKAFVASGKVDAAARAAKPQSQQEAADMRKAEQAGASHAKGGQAPSDRKSSSQR